MDAFVAFLTSGEAETDALSLERHAQLAYETFGTVDAVLQAPSGSNGLSKLKGVMTGNEWSRFEKICEAAREKNKNDASVAWPRPFALVPFAVAPSPLHSRPFTSMPLPL